MDSARCSVRLCRTEAVGESPVTCLPVCEPHMQDDLTELRDSEARVAQRIQHFKKYQTPLRLMQQRLTSDLQLLDDTFADLRETLDRCQADLIAAVTKQHDQLMDALASVSELDDFEKELKQAKDENNMRQAFIINRSMETSLKSFTLDSKFLKMNEDEEKVKFASYPDLNSTVRKLNIGVRAELTILRKVVEQFDDSNRLLNDEAELQVVKTSEIGQLSEKEKAVCLAVCSNTGSFVINDSGQVSAAAEDGSNSSQLPQPSIFVAVETLEFYDTFEDSSVDSNAETKSNILLMSADAEVVGHLICSWEADLPIRDLHCDNQRQLLFVAQRHAVTVTDLSGTEKSKIDVSDLLENGKKIYCMTGNSDKLFFLTKKQENRLILVGICKETHRVQMEFSLTDAYNILARRAHMTIEDRMLTLSDGHDVVTICTITGGLVSARSLSEDVVTVLPVPKDCVAEAFRIVSREITRAEFQLFPFASALISVPTSNEPHYILSADGSTRYQLVKVDDGRVIFESCRLDHVANHSVQSSSDCASTSSE